MLGPAARSAAHHVTRPSLLLIAAAACAGNDATEPGPPAAPAPTVSAVQPAAVGAGSPGLVVTITGSSFVATTVGRWNGEPRPTQRVSDSELRVALAATDLASAGSNAITVATPSPGGGVSASLAFTVLQPPPSAPVLRYLRPGGVEAGHPDLALRVHGSGFEPSSQVLWNGSPRPTTFLGSTELEVGVSAADVAAVGAALVSVRTPGPGGGESPGVPFRISNAGVLEERVIALPTRDVAYDAARGRLYASVGPTGGAAANSVIVVDPVTGELEAVIHVGADPGVLALADDGRFLYVALDGISQVRRIDLALRSAGPSFAVGPGSRVEDMLVLPGDSRAVAVTRRGAGSPRSAGLRIYDDGVPRPLLELDLDSPNKIEAAGSGTLFSYVSEISSFTLREHAVSPDGVRIVRAAGQVVTEFELDVRHAGGRLYFSNGQVVDGGSFTLLGACPDVASPVAPAVAEDRVYFVQDGAVTACSVATLTPLGTVTAGGTAGPIVRWGDRGLAWAGPTALHIIRTALVPSP